MHMVADQNSILTKPLSLGGDTNANKHLLHIHTGRSTECVCSEDMFNMHCVSKQLLEVLKKEKSIIIWLL